MVAPRFARNLIPLLLVVGLCIATIAYCYQQQWISYLAVFASDMEVTSALIGNSSVDRAPCDAVFDPDGKYRNLRTSFGRQFSTSELASLQNSGVLNETGSNDVSLPIDYIYNQHVRKCGGGLFQFATNTSARFIISELFEFPSSCLNHELANRTFFFAAIRHPVDRWVSEFHYSTIRSGRSPWYYIGEDDWEKNKTEEDILNAVHNWTQSEDTCRGVFCFQRNYMTRTFSSCREECRAYQPPGVQGRRIYNKFSGCTQQFGSHFLDNPPETFMQEADMNVALSTLKQFDAVIPLSLASKNETMDLLRFMGLNIDQDYRIKHHHITPKAWSIGDYPSVRSLLASLSDLDVKLYEEMERLWSEKLRLFSTHCR